MTGGGRSLQRTIYQTTYQRPRQRVSRVAVAGRLSSSAPNCSVSRPVWSPPLTHFSYLFSRLSTGCSPVTFRLVSSPGLRVPAGSTYRCQAQPGCQECLSSSIPPTQPRRPTLAQPKLSQASISSRPPLFLVHPFFPKFGLFSPLPAVPSSVLHLQDPFSHLTSIPLVQNAVSVAGFIDLQSPSLFLFFGPLRPFRNQHGGKTGQQASSGPSALDCAPERILRAS